MAWSKIQDSVQAMGTGTSGTFAYPSSPTAGHLLVVMATYNHSATQTFSISDTQGNAWVPLCSAQWSSQVNQTLQAWATIAKTTGADTISLSWTTGDANSGDIVLTEWSGITGGPTEDGSAQAYLSTTAASTCTNPSYTPGVTGDLVFNMVGPSDVINSMGSPWTNGDSYAYTNGTNHSSGGGAMQRTGAAWGFLTGTTSPVSANASPGASSQFISIIFGIQAVGASGGTAIPATPVSWPQAMWRSAYR